MPKVTKTNLTHSRISSEIDLLSDVNVSGSVRTKIKEDVADLIKSHILDSVAGSTSPVTGKPFEGLNKEYAKFKKAFGLSGKPNLEFSGDMLSALDVRLTGSGVEVGIFDSGQVGKADGHNNFSGKSSLPPRGFLPTEGQSFKALDRDITEIINEYVVASKKSNFSESKLSGIQSKSSLSSYFKEIFPDLTFRQAARGILEDEDLVQLFKSLDLFKYLSLG